MHLESSDSSDDSEDEQVEAETSTSAEAAGNENEEPSTSEEVDGSKKIHTAPWKNKVGSGTEVSDQVWWVLYENKVSSLKFGRFCTRIRTLFESLEGFVQKRDPFLRVQ